MNILNEVIDFLENEKEQSKYTNISPGVYRDFKKNVALILEEEKGGEKPNAKPVLPHKGYIPVENQKPAKFQGSCPSPDQSKITDMTIEELKNTVCECTKCVLHQSRKNVVFGEGNVNADLMFIGEGPGRDEDLHGRPFVGQSGQLLTKMIKAMGYERSEVYIANIVKCRPPYNRNPNPDEGKYCLNYLNRQIELIKPKVLVLLGAVPLSFLLDKRGITRLHGQWHEYMGIKTMPSFHPAYLLRDPSQKKYAWEDLQKVMKVLQ